MRRSSLSDLSQEPCDILVIGGGIVGAMTARDAALRGLRTILIERSDFGSGISHNSMKVMHGGIRYVQHLDFTRLRDSVRERAFWQRAASDHVRPLDFLMPLTGFGIKGPLAFGAAALLYSAASTGLRGPDYPPPSLLSARRARQLLGDIAPAKLTGGGRWRDGQIRDANRLQIACVAASTQAGGLAANYMEALSLTVEDDQVTGVMARDVLTGEEAQIRAKVTISCTGSAAPTLARSALPQIPADRFPQFAHALNLVTSRPAPALGLSLVSRTRADAVLDRGGRLYFLTPWEGGTIFGTHEAPQTDVTDWSATKAAVHDFITELNHACPGLSLAPEEVQYIYSGLIPANVDDEGAELQRQTRSTLIDHAKTDGIAGLITSIGIKYTTARLVGERSIDLAAAQMDRSIPNSKGLDTPLPEVGDTTLVPGDNAALEKRIRTAIEDEMALTLEDIVLRRSRLVETSALADEGGADLCSDLLGWDRAQQRREVKSIHDLLARHSFKTEADTRGHSAA